jgi:hypothetical protein
MLNDDEIRVDWYKLSDQGPEPEDSCETQSQPRNDKRDECYDSLIAIIVQRRWIRLWVRWILHSGLGFETVNCSWLFCLISVSTWISISFSLAICLCQVSFFLNLDMIIECRDHGTGLIRVSGFTFHLLSSNDTMEVWIDSGKRFDLGECSHPGRELTTCLENQSAKRRACCWSHWRSGTEVWHRIR